MFHLYSICLAHTFGHVTGLISNLPVFPPTATDDDDIDEKSSGIQVPKEFQVSISTKRTA